MPDTPYLPIPNLGTSLDSIYLLQADTKQRFDNVFSGVKQPLKYSIPTFEPDLKGLDQLSLLSPKVGEGAIDTGLFSGDPNQKNLAWALYNQKFTKDPVNLGVGVTKQYDYNPIVDKYLNSDFGYNPRIGIEGNEAFNYENEWQQHGLFGKAAAVVGKGLARVVGSVATKAVETLGFTGAMVSEGIQELFNPRETTPWQTLRITP
jgi:hypothetical protein